MADTHDQAPTRPWLALLGALLILPGCAQLRPDWQNQAEASEQITGVDRHSSYPAVRRIYFEQVNLVELIDPQARAKALYRDSWNATDHSA